MGGALVGLVVLVGVVGVVGWEIIIEVTEQTRRG